jgi:DNA modification methylase
VSETAISRTGDIFMLSDHRLIIGDARDEVVFKRLMQERLATMAFLDPPYNVRVNGHVGGRGNTKHREFACASGEMDSSTFSGFLDTTLGHCAAHTADGGITYVCMDWRHCPEMLKAGEAVYDELKNICVWAKTTPGQGTFYRSQHEFVFVYKTGNSPHLNSFQLGQHGRTRSNVWSYPGANCFRAGRMDDLKMHPTVKPLALVADAMRDCSKRGSIVLDAFCGSGTTLIAAEQLGRSAFCVEIDPLYADLAIRRWQKITGRDALREGSRQPFDEIEPATTASKTNTTKSKGQK